MIITHKFISYHKGPHGDGVYDSRKEIITIHDKKGNLLFSKDYTYIGENRSEKLVQTIDDGVVRNIVQGKTPCDFAIVEPSGDSVFFHLDAKKEPENIFFKDGFAFISFFNGFNILFNEDIKYEIHDAIIYHWYFRCKKYYETQLINSSDDSVSFHLDTEIEQNIPVEDSSFFSYTSPYKYYAIVVACVVVVSVVVVRRKRKGGK
jgi:hypothetical protein